MVQGKQLFFASQAPEQYLELGQAMEIKMPIEIFWEAEKFIKHINYLIGSGEPPTEVAVETRRLYKLLAPFCVDETHRTWMIDKHKN